MTYEEIIYMIKDELRLLSDDSDFTNEHIEFLCSKWRGYILETDNLNKKLISEFGYDTPLQQRLCLDMGEINPAISSYSCDGGTLLASKRQVPALINNSSITVDTLDYFNDCHLVYISNPERFKYQGCNKWLKDIIYAGILPDKRLWLKSANPAFKEIDKIKITGIFLNTEETNEMLCNGDGSRCNYMKSQYPISEHQVPLLIQYVVNELTNSIYRPKDDKNNSNYDLSKIGQIPNTRQSE